MTNSDIADRAALRELAEKANQGDWYCEVDGWPVWAPEPERGYLPYWASGINESENNPYKPYEISFETLAYVAAANPKAILALLDAYEAQAELLEAA